MRGQAVGKNTAASRSANPAQTAEMRQLHVSENMQQLQYTVQATDHHEFLASKI
jgi:hypothetical protein